ncbi:MAG: DHH family phosphoesterase [Clostridia bacterium]|nr:DHH family phosphoesterase [Clostridia bacterium]
MFQFKKDGATLRLTVSALLAVLFFTIYMLLCAHTRLNPLKTGALFIVLYIVLVVALELVCRYISTKSAGAVAPENADMLSEISLDIMGKLYLPVLICDESNKIIWYNRAFSKIADRSTPMYGMYLDSLAGITCEDIKAADNTQGGSFEVFEIPFAIKGYPFTTQGKSYLLSVWRDQSELHRALQRIADEEAGIAYIVIDNLGELAQFVHGKGRSVSAEVSQILAEWADSVGGLLQEYDNDKFMFIFNRRYLADFVESRFAVLDRVHEIRMGEENLPVTISIGIADISGTIAEKEAGACSALDMALQRGGDQAVVKHQNGMDIYGGRTKTVQKRTKVRSRVLAEEVVALISASANVLVMGHRNADFDSLGACCGMARISMYCGIKANIIANLDDPNLAKCFDKLLTLPEYRDIFVDSTSALDKIRSDTLLIIVDVNNSRQFESSEVYKNAHRVVFIDHHRKTEEFTEEPVLSYIEPSASSTCEIIAEMLETALPSGILEKEEADVMFAGIQLDTKQFTRNTGVRTFSAALYLRGEGANPVEANRLFRTDFEDFMRKARFEANIVIYRKEIAIAVSEADLSSGMDRIAAAKAADNLLTIDHVTASFALCRIGDVVHISARSSGAINVQIILEKLNGGGHYDSAAAQINGGTLEGALERLKEAIDEYMEN